VSAVQGDVLLMSMVDLQGDLPARAHHLARHIAKTRGLHAACMRVLPGRIERWRSGSRVERSEWEGVPLAVAHARVGPFSRLMPWGDKHATRMLERAAASFERRFAICIAEDPWAGDAALRLRAAGTVDRVVYDDVDRYAAFIESRRLGSALVERLERAALTRADAVVSVSGELKRRAAEFGVDSTWVPNGVDWALFRVSEDTPQPLSCVYVGSLHAWAGVREAVLGVGRLIDEGHKATLDIYGFGDPAYEGSLRELLVSRGWHRSIEIHGRIDPALVPEVLGGHRIGLATFEPRTLASFAFPLKVPEYWSAGLGVVGTDIGEVGRLLREGPCGEAVPYDPAAIASAVLRLSGEITPERMRSTREAARMYDWPALMARFDEVLTAAMSDRR